MFTRCPHCNTVFRIYAEQLAQAHGQVRCGICDSSFNSLENLSESPTGFAAPAPAATDAEERLEPPEEVDNEPPAQAETNVPQPSFEPQPLAAEREQPAVTGDDGATDIPPAQMKAIAAEPSIDAQPAPEHEQPVFADDGGEFDAPPLTPLEPESADFTTPWENAAAGRQVTNDEVAAPAFRILPDKPAGATPAARTKEDQEAALPPQGQADGDLPDLGIIAAEPRRIPAAELPGGWLKTTVWTVTNIALIVLLLGQYTYFNRNDLSQYPELRPWLTGFCALVSCNTPLQRDVSHINLANRIVQSNPSHSNALLIKATLVNEADFPQPYPLLEIRFSDLNNQLVAGRRFRPSEYLPANTSIQAGMPPHQPVHISLEVVDPGKEAVSFQFELL